MTNTTLAFGGLGNRINEIVNGIATFKRSGTLNWCVNEHLPFPYEFIFRTNFGFDTVINTHIGDSEYHGMGGTPAHGNLRQDSPYINYWYPANASMGVKMKSEDILPVYSEVMGQLRSFSIGYKYKLGLHYRKLGTSTGPLDKLMLVIKETWEEIGGGGDDKVFVLADSDRSEISKFLTEEGIPFDMCLCPELRNDMDRNSPSSMKLFLIDFLTLNECSDIVTSSAISTITDPARAFGSVIRHIGPCRTDPSCWFVANKPESFIQK